MTESGSRGALVERRRAFEWNLARDAQTAIASGLMRGRTHDLLNMVQIVELAAVELARRVTGEDREIVVELEQTAAAAKAKLAEILALARPPERGRGDPVAAAIRAAAEVLRPHVDALAVTVRLDPATATVLFDDELQHLVFALVLDGGATELAIRERAIEGKPWLELVAGVAGPAGELRVAEAIVERGGGELTASPGRNGTEIVAALPVRG